MQCQKESSKLSMQGPVWTGDISHPLYSPNHLPLFGPQAQAGPRQRTGQDNSQGKNIAKGKPGEVEARAPIPASIFHAGTESMAPKIGCILQIGIWAVRNSAGGEEMSEHV